MALLNVFRSWRGGYQLVGSLFSSPGDFSAQFAYDPSYAADPSSRAISASLPLRTEPFSSEETESFFSGLAPEGNMRRLLSESIHSPSFRDALSRLNNESTGALIFSTGDQIDETDLGYDELSVEDLVRLRDHPRETAFELGMASRLSLAGAQSKAGLYHVGPNPLEGWFAPRGAAPSTHIVKTPEEAFPNQTVNEALCLEISRLCGFDSAEWELVPIPGGEPLLAVRRFDRVEQPGTEATANGMPIPLRLHQEDFCQATGLPSHMKYEPTGGHYLSRCARVLSEGSRDPFGDRAVFFQEVLLDYLIGNCDNHLKNHSMLWDADWGGRGLSPRYDVACTTIYPAIYLEMGVSLCPSRRICDVRPGDIEQAAGDAGIPIPLARSFYRSLREELPLAIDRAEEPISEMGFPEVSAIADHIRSELESKFSLPA